MRSQRFWRAVETYTALKARTEATLRRSLRFPRLRHRDQARHRRRPDNHVVGAFCIRVHFALCGGGIDDGCKRIGCGDCRDRWICIRTEFSRLRCTVRSLDRLLGGGKHRVRAAMSILGLTVTVNQQSSRLPRWVAEMRLPGGTIPRGTGERYGLYRNDPVALPDMSTTSR